MRQGTASVDELARAYAVLGLRPGVSAGELRRAYRFLARRWHPDRHAGDARSLQEAGLQMRRINEAYGTIVASLRAAAPAASRPARSRRLSREERDGMVAAIGTDGPVDWMLGSIGWVGSTLEGLAAVVFLGISLAGLIAVAWRRDWRGLLHYADTLLFFGVLIILGVREAWARARIGSAATRGQEPQSYAPPERPGRSA